MANNQTRTWSQPSYVCMYIVCTLPPKLLLARSKYCNIIRAISPVWLPFPSFPAYFFPWCFFGITSDASPILSPRLSLLKYRSRREGGGPMTLDVSSGGGIQFDCICYGISVDPWLIVIFCIHLYMRLFIFFFRFVSVACLVFPRYRLPFAQFPLSFWSGKSWSFFFSRSKENWRYLYLPNFQLYN